MMNPKRTTQWIGLPAALTLALALPGGAEPAWKKVQSKLANQKQSSDAQAGQAADAAAGAVDPEVEAMKAKAAAEAREGSVQEIPVEGQPAAAPADGTVGLPSAGGGRNPSGTPQINLGKEGEDSAPVNDVFKDPQFLKMIGDKPVFIYNAVDKPDPMIFPPIRIAAIYLEYIAQADELLLDAGVGAESGRSGRTGPVNREKIREAVVILNKARALNDPRYIPQIDQRLREIGEFIGQIDAAADPKATPTEIDVIPTPEAKEPELPVEIADATNGVIAGEVPYCLIGDALLTVGDTVPSYPEVTVAAIGPGSVTFTVRQGEKSKDFPIEVKGYDDPGDVSQLTSGERDRSRTARRR